MSAGKLFSEPVWAKVIGELDQNSDGLVSFEEFEAMMNRQIN